MGEEFEPYLPVVMPSLLTTASAKADISVYGGCRVLMMHIVVSIFRFFLVYLGPYCLSPPDYALTVHLRRLIR